MFDSNQFFGGQADTGFYPETLDGSLRFNDDDSAYLSWTPASAGNRKTWTWSAWVKRGNLGTFMYPFAASESGNTDQMVFGYTSSDTIRFYANVDGTNVSTTAVYRDVGAWYHIVAVLDTTQSTSTDRIKVYVNGEAVALSGTFPALNRDLPVNSTSRTHSLGSRQPSSDSFFDGYLSNVHFVDGTALDADDFGETKSGVWIPKAYTGSYGTNGFHLPLDADADDVSGNGNDWTENNLAATDYVLDSPTNNFATLNVLDKGSIISTEEGNLEAISTSSASRGIITGTVGVSSGKWYYEAVIGTERIAVGFVQQPASLNQTVGYDSTGYGYNWGGFKINNNVSSSYGATFTTGDIIGVALDLDAGTITFYKNNSSQGTAFTGLSGEFVAAIGDGSSGGSASAVVNFGQDSSFAGNKTAQGNTDANGIGDFYYTPPSGYLALCTSNLPEPAFSPADDASPQDHFNTVLYTGNGSTQSITGVGFQPNFTWIKKRSSTADNHVLQDAVRGVGKGLFSDLTNAENSTMGGMTSFDSDGFTFDGSISTLNGSGFSMVAWNWKANGSGVSNTDGSITSTVSANTDAGFSIVTWTGTGANGTIGHGLDSAPEVMIVKDRDYAYNWYVFHNSTGSNLQFEGLNTTSAASTQTDPNNFVPTSSVIAIPSVASKNTNGNGMLCYCFHSVEGFSKFGSYTGNGSSDGTFVYTGFKPALVILKRTDAANNWIILDTVRDPYNDVENQLLPNRNYAEEDVPQTLDILSNGFKLRDSHISRNASGGEYIYMAFAENPFKYTTAR